METIRDYSKRINAKFFVIGDTKSPVSFKLDGADYYDIDRQYGLDMRFAKACPTRHYARKNIGYLLGAKMGAETIIETDDDNIPVSGFEAKRDRNVTADIVTESGWCNIYKLFSDKMIWPRGLPLTELMKGKPVITGSGVYTCPIQQGLADRNPDVDALYRLAFPLPFDFDKRGPVVLDKGVWCPFNSQNTTFFAEAFPLLYLPYHCSFRMTDIWRGFVAQRVLWESDWKMMFHSATVYQERNEHDLMRDFEDEVPGYLGNEKIRRTLEDLDLKSGSENMHENVLRCYKSLIALGVIGAEEEKLVSIWLQDLSDATGA
jgi:hypothetical protein